MNGPGRLWRTLRHLRPGQLAAQLRWRVAGARPPRPWQDQPPALRIRSAAVPFLGAPGHARLLPPRGLRLLNREVHFPDAIDWDFADEGPLWAFHLHQFDYLRDPELAPPVRAALLLDWIERHPRGVGWSAPPTSLRSANWLALLLSPDALVLDASAEARVRASLAAQLDTLARNLETHLGANHLLSNLLALVFAGIVLDAPAADAWLAHEGRLRQELEAQVLPDGAHQERSPMYHALLLEQVLNVVNAVAAAPGRAPAALEESLRDAAARMLGALGVWTQPDGRIALFGDSAWGVAQEPQALVRQAAALGVAARPPARSGVLDAAGFVRLARGPFTLIASVAGPMPAHQPGHAHADALAFELCVGRERVVTDTGVSEYLPGALRDASRATRSHATVEVDGRDQAELWAAHRVGGRPRVTLVSVAPGRSAEATCAGWATPDTLHRRRFRVDDAAVELRDAIEGRPRPVRLVLPLAPGLEPELAAESARLRLSDGRRLELALPRGVAWRVERLPHFPEFGRVEERAALVGRASRFASGSWLLRLAGA